MDTAPNLASRAYLLRLTGAPRDSIVREWVRAGLADRPGCATLERATTVPTADANSSGHPTGARCIKRVCVRGGGALGQLMAWMLEGIPGIEVVLATRRRDLKEAVDLQGGKLFLKRETADDKAKASDIFESRNAKIALLENPPGTPAEVVWGGNFDAVLICTKSGQTADAGMKWNS